MPADFKVVFRLLEFTEGEVQGRQSARPSPQVEKLIGGLLSGEIDAVKRRQLCESLGNEPRWLAWLAEQIKARRKGSGKVSPDS
jgi:hypothetical protein